MLMAAVTSTSPGTDTTSTRPAASGHTESASMSFVESFVENTAAAGETPLDVRSQTKPGKAIESDGSTPTQTASAVISAAGPAMNVTQRVQSQTEDGKSLSSPGTVMAGVPVANKTGSSVASAMPQRDAKPSETNASTQATMYDDQFVPIVPEGEISQGQKLVNNASDQSVQNGTNKAEDLDLEIATPGMPPATGGSVKPVIAGKSDGVASGKSQDNTTGRVIKGQGTSVKTEKGTKAETKHDKKDKVDVAVSAASVDTQTTVLAQVFVNPAGAQQSVAGDAEADVLPATSAAASSRSIGTVAANGKGNKAAANTGKPDGSTVKTPVSSSMENPLSPKTEADATKPEAGIAANPDADKLKPQSTVASATESGQLRAVSVASGPAPGAASGSGLIHNAGAGLHTTDAVSHAVATAQTDANLVATTSSVDVGHKTLMATPTSLEVGVSNGTHGWLKIRAEMADGGSVNTSLSTSSSAAQEMLHRELPSLAAYLKSEHVAVNAVVVQPMPASGPDTRGTFAGTSSGEHGQAQQGGSQGRESRQSSANPTPAHAGTSVAYSSLGAGEDEIFSSSSYVQGGGWLSVRA